MKFVPDSAQEKALVNTMGSFNGAANTLAQITGPEYARSMVKLQKRVYAALRKQFDLPAQLAIPAISKAARAL